MCQGLNGDIVVLMYISDICSRHIKVVCLQHLALFGKWFGEGALEDPTRSVAKPEFKQNFRRDLEHYTSFPKDYQD